MMGHISKIITGLLFNFLFFNVEYRYSSHIKQAFSANDNTFESAALFAWNMELLWTARAVCMLFSVATFVCTFNLYIYVPVCVTECVYAYIDSLLPRCWFNASGKKKKFMHLYMYILGTIRVWGELASRAHVWKLR